MDLSGLWVSIPASIFKGMARIVRAIRHNASDWVWSKILDAAEREMRKEVDPRWRNAPIGQPSASNEASPANVERSDGE